MSANATIRTDGPRDVRVLLVGGGDEWATALSTALKECPAPSFNVTVCGSPAEALAVLKGDSEVDLLLVDHCLPTENGILFIESARHHRPDIPAVLWSVTRDFDLAVAAIRMHLAAFFVKGETSLLELPMKLADSLRRPAPQSQRWRDEISAKRFEAIRRTIVETQEKINQPVGQMRAAAAELAESQAAGRKSVYAAVINDNTRRIADNLVRLVNLDRERTTAYVGDVRMLDLREAVPRSSGPPDGL